MHRLSQQEPGAAPAAYQSPYVKGAIATEAAIASIPEAERSGLIEEALLNASRAWQHGRGNACETIEHEIKLIELAPQATRAALADQVAEDIWRVHLYREGPNGSGPMMSAGYALMFRTHLIERLDPSERSPFLMASVLFAKTRRESRELGPAAVESLVRDIMELEAPERRPQLQAAYA